VDWSSNRPVYHVFVKGGPGGNLYSYGQGATKDWGLTAPINDNNDQVYAASHVTFYYTEEIEEVIEPLQLTSVCSDQRGKARFRVYNPNSFDLDFSYENVDNNNVGGTGTALAEDYTFFYVDAADNAANTTKLYWEGGSTVKASSNQYCKYEVTVIKEWQNSSNEVIDPPDNWVVIVEENGNTHNLGPANVSANFWLEFDQTFTVNETIEGYSPREPASSTGKMFISTALPINSRDRTYTRVVYTW